MGSIKSVEEVQEEVDELKGQVELLQKFAEALDSRMDDFIPVTMKSMSKRVRTLKQDIKKSEEKSHWLIFIAITGIALIISAFMTVRIKELKDELSTANNFDIGAVQTQLLEYKAQLIENANEISQLKDRIIFLSFLPAIYSSEEVEENIETEVETVIVPEIENQKEYINLFTIGQNVPLPTGIDTNTFRCMDYHKITDKTSWQYDIQCLSRTASNGLRIYDYGGETYYTVALATAYGIDLGNAYEVELENGTIFNIVHAEYKHDIRYPRADDFGDPDMNYDDEPTISVIEFVYDWRNAPKQLIGDGEANRFLGENCDIYGNGCNIKRMTYLGKIWNVT